MTTTSTPQAPVQPPARPPGRSPVSPKTHAAGLGAGFGSALAAIIVGLIQSYGTHKALPQADVSAVYLVCGPGLAWLASYFAPHR